MKESYLDIRYKLLEIRENSNKEIWHIMNSVKRLTVKGGS
jgi:hypothetical protein